MADRANRVTSILVVIWAMVAMVLLTFAAGDYGASERSTAQSREIQ